MTLTHAGGSGIKLAYLPKEEWEEKIEKVNVKEINFLITEYRKELVEEESWRRN